MAKSDNDPVSHAADAKAEGAAIVARDAMAGLDQLLTGQAPGEVIGCERVGALVGLIAAAAARALPG